MSTPRVVIGAGAPNKLPALVAEYSIRKYCPEAVVIQTYDVPFCKDGNNRLVRDRWEDPCEWVPSHPTGTLFSYCRTMVPEICGFQGEAIYIDADMILFGDITEMWNIPMNGKYALRQERSHQFAVVKLDCEALAPWPIGKLLRDGVSYREILQGRYIGEKNIGRTIPDVWNCLDRKPKGCKLLHYTRMPTQPWVSPGHPVGGVWFDLLAEAVQENFITREQVEEMVKPHDLTGRWPAACWPQAHVFTELDKRLVAA